jgi:oxygen-independent coproporphyrinogen-3 oxidase
MAGETMDLSVYVHVPFCISKCYYCDFISFPYDQFQVHAYIHSLEREFRLYAELLPGKQVKTLYFGGGTPSCLSCSQLADLFGICLHYFSPADNVEVTIEANPGTITREKLAVFQAYGVNRISLGVQALQDELLSHIGRIHQRADVLRSYNLIREAGFNNVSMDLIFALPNQTLSQWEETLTGVITLAPDHISTYNLVVERGTKFYQWREEGRLSPVSEDLDLAMYQLARDILCQRGYKQYEISNFALPGKNSRHNLTYWHNKPYWGFGPSAHSFFQGERRANEGNLKKYREKLKKNIFPVAFREIITKELEQAETMFLGLRLLAGVAREEFQQRFGSDPVDVFWREIQALVGKGLVEYDAECVRLTEKGLIFANQVFMEFLPE